MSITPTINPIIIENINLSMLSVNDEIENCKKYLI